MTIPLPILFLLAAVAIVAYRARAQAPAETLELPTLAPPGIAPPAAAAPASGGMSLLWLAPWVLVAWMLLRPQHPAPAPPPQPAPQGELNLRGLFRGESAAADAQVTSSLMAELADVVEWDGAQQSPRITTGAAIHDLRTAARDLRCRGVRLGDRQPAVRDEIKRFLDARAGTEGGPLDDASRGRWVSAYREVARAAEAAAR